MLHYFVICYRLFDWQITLVCVLMSFNMIEAKENAITNTV